jgi:hypothetical protein
LPVRTAQLPSQPPVERTTVVVSLNLAYLVDHEMLKLTGGEAGGIE